MAHTFLSEEWFLEVDRIRAGVDEDAIPAVLRQLNMNVVVTGGPDGDKEIHFSDGNYKAGLDDAAPTKVTIPFEIAKAIFVDGNQQVAIQAFMSGQIKVEGDMTKLMAIQSAGEPTGSQRALTERIKAITL